MVGSFLTDAFMERGETVYSPSRQEMDITDRKKVVDTIRKINPDILIHCAALTHVDECEIDKKRAYLVNVIGTQHIIEVRILRKMFDRFCAGIDDIDGVILQRIVIYQKIPRVFVLWIYL